MLFWVKLIEVNETDDGEAREDLNANCTHVGLDYWLFEGDLDALHDGIHFIFLGEEAIEGHGDLSGSQLKEFVKATYIIDKSF